MAKVGADIPQLEDLRKALEQNSLRSQEILKSVDTKLKATYWEGPAADRFKSAWDNEFKSALNKLNEALQEASAEVNRRKQALETATR